MKLESLLCSCGTFLISHDLLSNNLATLLWRQDKNTKTVHKTPRDRCASHQNTPSSRIEDGKFLKKAVEGEEAKKKTLESFFLHHSPMKGGCACLVKVIVRTGEKCHIFNVNSITKTSCLCHPLTTQNIFNSNLQTYRHWIYSTLFYSMGPPCGFSSYMNLSHLREPFKTFFLGFFHWIFSGFSVFHCHRNNQ